ncbi:thiolase domain-containing protein [Novosphingobium mathurense]|uniref:Acetyl-CoA C-acetyltransferase n=1 Tax=Novosphingobium mathurense TaxID=428990 RepID=A0A1U6IL74_9SPHN|nr:thiolase domain-containing protein [Novosphingobium mathurense]SLK08763.1 acetyl-CoA C-acetyltransferase [Novosphingobium mathurense]
MTSAAIIVGWGHTPFGRHDALPLEALIHAAAQEALANAGLSGGDVDAVWLGHFNGGLVPDAFCSAMALGADAELRFKPATRCENACASGSAALYAAMNAIDAGRVKIALVVGVERMSGRDAAGVTAALGGAAYQPEEAGLSFPEIFARYAKAYAERFGDPSDAMARIAVKNHAHALDNPLAQMRRALDYDFCANVSEKNPLIAPPLRKTDCSLVSDGAAAVVLAHWNLHPDFRRAVRFRAAVQVSDLLPLSAKELARFEGPRRAFERAYAQARVGVEDLDFAEVHDCFTIAELLTVEAMGLAQPGDGPAIVREGLTTKGGSLPINLSGGLKAKGHPVGATGVSMHVLAARQLVGEAGAMQVDGAQLGLCFNMGGGAVANYVSILEPLKV